MARSKSLSKQRPLFLESVKGSWTSGSSLIKEATFLIRMESSLFTWQQAANLDMNSSSWVSKSLGAFSKSPLWWWLYLLHSSWGLIVSLVMRILFWVATFSIFSAQFWKRKKNFYYWLFGLLQGSVCAEEMTLTELHTSLPRLQYR